MSLTPCLEAASCAATKELPSTLWNPNIRYRLHKNPPLVPIMSEINPIHTSPPYLSSIQFNIIYPPILVFLVILSFCLSHEYPICIPLFPHSRYISKPYHSPWLDHFNHTWQRVQVMELLIMKLSRTSCHFISLVSNNSICFPPLMSEFHTHTELRAKSEYYMNDNCNGSGRTQYWSNWSMSTIPRSPLWSSGQSFSLQIQRSGFDSRCYQIFREVVGLERGTLSLVSTIEELLGRKVTASV
jgi:hypothetical protein